MINLADLAYIAMTDRGFIPDFSEQVIQELNQIKNPAHPEPSTRDKRDLFWVSIDNDDSKDLDQLTYAEKGKIFIAVADVDALVKPRSAIDIQAAHNTTSVYTPLKVFPMLPLKLSTDLTSLNEACDRCAIVIEMNVQEDGSFSLNDIYAGFVRNKAKLTYSNVGKFLEENGVLSHSLEGLEEQLRLQDHYAQLIRDFRERQGALTLETIELELVIEKERAIGLQQRLYNRAHQLIENFMIAANVGVTRFLLKEKLPVLRRIVRTPKKWERIVQLAHDLDDKLSHQPSTKALRDFLLRQKKNRPDQFVDLSLAVIKLVGRGEYVLGIPGDESPGHFDLALVDYSHTTAPNRRYPDMIMQRLVKSKLFGTPIPYTQEELDILAEHCTAKEDDATKVERRMYKSAAALYLQPRIGERFKAMVTGSGARGTWVRLSDPPIEGKLVHGAEGLDVGDYLTVQLVHTDVVRGYIDFSR